MWLGLVGLLTVGISYCVNMRDVFWGDKHIWWTPVDAQISIEETKGNFEIYIGGVELKKRLSEGSLMVLDENGSLTRLTSKDIGVRMNNWDKTRASILEETAFSGIAFGAALVLFIIGVGRYFRERKLDKDKVVD